MPTKAAKLASLMLPVLLAGTSAEAAGTYVLTTVRNFNAFVPAGGLFVGAIPNGGQCVVSAGGAVDCTGIQFSMITSSTTFNYTNGSWTTSVGGTSVSHTETCTESAGAICVANKFGLTGIWATGLQNGGAASNTCAASNYFAAGACDQVSVEEVAGVSLRILEQSEFVFDNQPGGMLYEFTAVPVPAAAWLFGGALLAAAGWRHVKSDGASS